VSCYIGRKADKGATEGSAISWADFCTDLINCKLVGGGLFREFEMPFSMLEARLPHPTWKKVLISPRVALLADEVPNAVADLPLRGLVIP
jgi:hypothetical protein